MSINRIEIQYQNYAATDISDTKSNSSESTVDSFQKMMVNWEKRMKETMDKERENDSKGNIQMSEKQWHNLMRKVDTAIDNTNDNIKEEQAEKKQLEEKNHLVHH